MITIKSSKRSTTTPSWVVLCGFSSEGGGRTCIWRRRAAWPLGEQHQHQHVVKLVVGPMDPTGMVQLPTRSRAIQRKENRKQSV